MEPLSLFFKDQHIKTVLDVGTGKGAFIEVLSSIFEGAKITAIDPDRESLNAAREHFPEVSFMEMTAERLLFNDNSFDLASLSMALHHLRKINRGLREMKRVVKPGGWIIINELISDNLNPAQEMHKMHHHFRSRIDRMTGISHREAFTKDAILQMLKVADIPVQFFFEDNEGAALVEDKSEIEYRVRKMEEALERIKDREEYKTMKPLINEFYEKALKHGFQTAPRLIIAGRVK